MQREPAPHPGKVLREQFMAPQGLDAAALAAVINVPEALIRDLVAGGAAMTRGLAVRLGRHFGKPVAFWLDLQAVYDGRAAEFRRDQQLIREWKSASGERRDEIAEQLIRDVREGRRSEEDPLYRASVVHKRSRDLTQEWQEWRGARLKPARDAVGEERLDEEVEFEDEDTGWRWRGSRGEAFLRALDALAAGIRVREAAKALLTPADLEGRLHAVSAAAGELLKALGASANGEVSEMPEQMWAALTCFAAKDARKSGSFIGSDAEHLSFNLAGIAYAFDDLGEDERLHDNIKRVEEIQRWAHEAEIWLGKTRPRRGSAGHSNVGLVIQVLCQIWEQVLGLESKRVYNKGRAEEGGALVRFICDCLRLLGMPVPRGSYAVGEHVARYKRSKRSDMVE